MLPNNEELFYVNEVVDYFGITARILKNYEQTGIVEPKRTEKSKYRLYTAEEVMKIQSVERLKRMGMSLRDIGKYFSGELDIEKQLSTLKDVQASLEKVIKVFEAEMNLEQRIFSVAPAKEFLCYCHDFPYSANFADKYYASKKTYTDSIKDGCVTDCNKTFFLFHENFFSDNKVQPLSSTTVCIPILKAPESNSNVRLIRFAPSLVLQFTGQPTTENSIQSLLEEAERRNLCLSGKLVLHSETGPNVKGIHKAYSLTYSAEIAQCSQAAAKDVANT